jgi:hypothetical protein
VSSAIQQLHDLEIQGAIGWPVDGKIIVRLGCPLDNKFETEALVSSFAEAERWLRTAAKVAHQKGARSKPSVVDELFAADMPATALWVFDRMFQATFAPPEDTTAAEKWIGAESWAELEERLREEAYLRRPSLAKKASRPRAK